MTAARGRHRIKVNAMFVEGRTVMKKPIARITGLVLALVALGLAAGATYNWG